MQPDGNRRSLAYLYATQAKYSEAEVLYNRSMTIMEVRMAVTVTIPAGTSSMAAPLCGDRYSRNLTPAQSTFSPDHPEVAQGANFLAWVCFKLGRFTEADRLYKRSLDIRQKVVSLSVILAVSLSCRSCEWPEYIFETRVLLK
jgi:hypothetical protein